MAVADPQLSFADVKMKQAALMEQVRALQEEAHVAARLEFDSGFRFYFGLDESREREPVPYCRHCREKDGTATTSPAGSEQATPLPRR